MMIMSTISLTLVNLGEAFQVVSGMIFILLLPANDRCDHSGDKNSITVAATGESDSGWLC